MAWWPHCAARPRNHQGAVPALGTEGFDAGAGCFGDAQAIEGQQRDQRMLSRSALVNTGVTGTRAVDGIVVAIWHLRDSR